MKAECASHRVWQWDARSFAGAIRQGIVLVDFDEPWCGPCRMQRAILENLAARIGSQATVGAVNVDEAQDVAVRFHVECLPTLLLFKDGQLRHQFAGVQHESRLAQAIQALASE